MSLGGVYLSFGAAEQKSNHLQIIQSSAHLKNSSFSAVDDVVDDGKMNVAVLEICFG